MRIFFLFGLTNCLQPRDACSLVHRESRCEESGLCSSLVRAIDGGYEVVDESQSNVSCSDAYMSLADKLNSTTISDPPIIVPIDDGQLRAINQRETQLAHSTQSRLHVDWSITNVTLHEQLTALIDSLAAKLTAEFPEIIYHPIADAPLLGSLVQLSRRLRRSTSATNSPLYKSLLSQEESVRKINWFLLTIILSIYGTSSIEMREAKIAHSIPFFHAWSWVYYNLDFPTLLYPIGQLGFYAHISKRDPLYPRNPPHKVWVIGLPKRLTETEPQRFYIPPVIGNIESDFPLSAFQYLSLNDDTLQERDPLLIVQPVMEHMTSINYTSSRCLWCIIEYLETALFVVQNHPQVTGETRELFCRTTKVSWEAFFQAASAPEQVGLEGLSPINLVRLFDICGAQYLTLRDRVVHVLPVVAGVRLISDMYLRYGVNHDRLEPVASWLPEAIELINEIPIYHIRRWMLIGFGIHVANTQSNFAKDGTEYMSILIEVLLRLSDGEYSLFEQNEGKLVPTQSANPAHLFVFGSVVALLVVYGDPRGALSDVLSRQSDDKNFYFNSRSVRRGFCRVVNCDIFETLFTDTEFREVLEVLRTTKPLTRIVGDYR